MMRLFQPNAISSAGRPRKTPSSTRNTVRTHVLLFFLSMGFLLPNVHALPLAADEHAMEWLLLGPLSMPDEGEGIPDRGDQLAFFRTDHVDPGIRPEAGQAFPFGGTRLLWNPMRSDEKGRVLLDEWLGEHAFASAYAYAVLESDKARRIHFGLGSDDAVRVWLNGELVHEFWGGRGLSLNEDLVTLHLKAGENRLLIKVQNMEYGWGFALQHLNKEALDKRLALAAGHGDLDIVQELLAIGADPMAEMGPGLNAWQFARIRGRRDVCNALVEAGADSTRAFPATEELASWLLEEEVGDGHAGAAVLVARGHEVVFKGAAGLADVQEGRSLTEGSLFRIGSVTKPITATAILMLVDAGALTLEQTIDRWYPDIPHASSITIEQLLTHTSGMASYTEQADFSENVESYIKPSDLEALIAGLEPDFAPGTSWAYSNSGYFLLGRIVQKVSGSSYEAFLQEHVFSPHDMVRTSVYDNRQEILRRDEALGHAWNGESYERAMDWDMSWAGGAGAIQSTAADMHLFAQAWFGGKLLTEATMTAATQAVQINGQKANAFGHGYGYGWALGEFRGEPFVWHSGGLHGFVSQLAYFPRLDMYSIALVNAAPSHGLNAQALASSLVEIAAWWQLAPQESYFTKAVSDLSLEDYNGRYAYPGGAVMTVRSDNGQLLARLTGQQEFELYPRGEDEFFWKVVEASIQFVRNDEGAVTGGLHRQGGGEIEVGKIEEEQTAELDAAHLDRLTGVYILRGMDMTVERRGNSLWVLMPGQSDVEIFPRSQTEFFLKVVQAKVVFALSGDEGPARALTLYQGGMEMRAERKAP